ncbi:lysophospholipid acyltransferase family protein [Virgibacillus soli]|uniref:lysophospholipid acyltransferase family protein n=1 Tax=Paracerasibacillus soli TaxID=480284 RepID=UPI0035EBC6B4
MIHTIKIYGYAALLVIGSLFNLKKAKKKLRSHASQEVINEIFETPKVVSQKVFHKTGSHITIKGKENITDEAVLYVANHQGIFDILVLLGFLGEPVGFIAKREIQKLPIIRKWMEIVHCVFIDRNDRRQSICAIQQGTQNLKEGHSMVIFPEGTRSKGKGLSSFKPGSLRLGTKANVPIVPITIEGTYKMLEETNRIKPANVIISIGKPIYPEAYEKMNSKQLAAHLQEKISDELAILKS